MSAKIDNSRGYVRISNNVISKLAGYAATNCYGVVGMAVKSGKDGIAKLLKRENIEDGLEISLHIVVEYGINISVIGESIKNNVKYQVEEATGIDVKSVIVNVEGIRVNQ